MVLERNGPWPEDIAQSRNVLLGLQYQEHHRHHLDYMIWHRGLLWFQEEFAGYQDDLIKFLKGGQYLFRVHIRQLPLLRAKRHIRGEASKLHPVQQSRQLSRQFHFQNCLLRGWCLDRGVRGLRPDFHGGKLREVRCRSWRDLLASSGDFVGYRTDVSVICGCMREYIHAPRQIDAGASVDRSFVFALRSSAFFSLYVHHTIF